MRRVREWLIRSVDVRGKVDRAGFLRRPAVPSRTRLHGFGLRRPGVGEELSVDGVGDPALEAPHGFHPGLARGELATVVGPPRGCRAGPGWPRRCGACGSSSGSRPARAGAGSAPRRRRPGVRCRSRTRSGCGRRTGRRRRHQRGSVPRRRVRPRAGPSAGSRGPEATTSAKPITETDHSDTNGFTTNRGVSCPRVGPATCTGGECDPRGRLEDSTVLATLATTSDGAISSR